MKKLSFLLNENYYTVEYNFDKLDSYSKQELGLREKDQIKLINVTLEPGQELMEEIIEQILDHEK